MVAFLLLMFRWLVTGSRESQFIWARESALPQTQQPIPWRAVRGELVEPSHLVLTSGLRHLQLQPVRIAGVGAELPGQRCQLRLENGSRFRLDPWR